MLPQNEEAVRAIKKTLEPRVLGKQLPGWSCNCGCVTGATAIATKINPAGKQFPGQEALWFLWTVKMTPVNPEDSDRGWSCGLSEFVPVEELKALFRQHFANADD